MFKETALSQKAFESYAKAMKFNTLSHSIDAVVKNAEAGCIAISRLMLAKVCQYENIDISTIRLLHEKIDREYIKKYKIGDKCPKISVIVPYHNRKNRIKKCLESVLNQSFFDIEVIAVDDGSTDGSYEIASSINDERLKHIKCSVASGNSGTPRNIGLKFARGDYIAFVDSDDFIENEFLSQLYECTINNKKIDIVFSNYFKKIENTNAKEKTLNIKYNFISSFINGEERGFYFSNSFVVWDKLYKRDFLWENKIFFSDSKIGADTLMLAKAYFFSRDVHICMNKSSYCYLSFSEDSVSKKYRKAGDIVKEDYSYKKIFQWMIDDDVDQGYVLLQWIRRVMSISYCLNSCEYRVSNESLIYLKDLMKTAPIKSMLLVLNRNNMTEHKENLYKLCDFVRAN